MVTEPSNSAERFWIDDNGGFFTSTSNWSATDADAEERGLLHNFWSLSSRRLSTAEHVTSAAANPASGGLVAVAAVVALSAHRADCGGNAGTPAYAAI
ncbi:MAG: hypothetical protein RH917_17955 [Lacipirellulaceae bacterium]